MPSPDEGVAPVSTNFGIDSDDGAQGNENLRAVAPGRGDTRAQRAGRGRPETGSTMPFYVPLVSLSGGPLLGL